MRRLIIIDRREGEASATAASSRCFSSVGSGDTSRRLSLDTAAVMMTVSVWRQTGGEVITNPNERRECVGYFIIKGESESERKGR